MNQVLKLKKLNQLSWFDKNTLAQIIDIPDNSLSANIKRWIKKGVLIPLKNGLYVTAEYVASVSDKASYAEMIANKLREPSYVSLEYVLQKHNVLTEAVYALTSVTLKAKRNFSNAFGNFIYHNIKDDLFMGYEIKERSSFLVREATKAKALFDYLYFKTLRIQTIERDYVESLRLDVSDFSDADLNEFALSCARAKTKKLQQLIDLIGEARDA